MESEEKLPLHRTKQHHIMKSSLFFFVLAVLTDAACAFSGVLFQEAPAARKTVPSTVTGVDIELPDFGELFGRIQQVSPLARSVITGAGPARGFAATDDGWPGNLPWKTIESNERKTVHAIHKIDNFNGRPAPLLRFRSSLTGPCVGECFANFIMDLEERKKWDLQIHDVKEVYPLNDLDHANIAMGFGRYGDCSRLGVGFCQTKANLGISPREQLTLCGIQDFSDGSCIIWGTEMEERYDYMFPPGERHTRAKSHLFSTTLTPTGDNTFDVEYVLQLEVGGKLPVWLTTPIMTDSIKRLFQTAADFYAAEGEGGALDQFLKAKEQEDQFAGRHALLMTP